MKIAQPGFGTSAATGCFSLTTIFGEIANGEIKTSRLWPGDVAAGVAIGPADAIVTMPLRDGDSYAYYGGDGIYDDSFAYYGDRPVSRRTACGLQPGATYPGPDGRCYPC